MSRIIPLAFAAGLNVYATVAVIGLSVRYHLVALPEDYQIFGHPIVIGVAIAMFLVEFVADKIPWLDSVWDAVHTVVRPLGGAYIAAATLGGDASPLATTIAALVGGSTALTTHVTKAGTRAAANTSPEPFSNWLLSLGEDFVAVSLSYGALKHPMVALIVAVVLLVAIVLSASFLIRALRRRFAARRAPTSA
jgi:uncharacterized protein DUF4126